MRTTLSLIATYSNPQHPRFGQALVKQLEFSSPDDARRVAADVADNPAPVDSTCALNACHLAVVSIREH